MRGASSRAASSPTRSPVRTAALLAYGRGVVDLLCLAISLRERAFDCLCDALLVPDGEVVGVEDHSCHTMRLNHGGDH